MSTDSQKQAIDRFTSIYTPQFIPSQNDTHNEHTNLENDPSKTLTSTHSRTSLVKYIFSLFTRTNGKEKRPSCFNPKLATNYSVVNNMIHPLAPTVRKIASHNSLYREHLATIDLASASMIAASIDSYIEAQFKAIIDAQATIEEDETEKEDLSDL